MLFCAFLVLCVAAWICCEANADRPSIGFCNELLLGSKYDDLCPSMVIQALQSWLKIRKCYKKISTYTDGLNLL